MTTRSGGTRTKKEAAAVDRRAVLDAASRLLATEGPSALSMRRLATEVGTSTMVLYSRFESRDALVTALLAEGFTRFADELAGVHEPEPFANLHALGLAYRRFAQQNPTYYRLMWSGLSDPECVSETLRRPGHRAFLSLVQAVTRIFAALDRPARQIEPVTVSVWSAVHGFVSLELGGQIPPDVADAAYEQTLQLVAAGLRTQP